MNAFRTEEQRLIESSALDWLTGHYDFRAREVGVHRDGGNPAAWHAFAELGWLAMPLPSAYEGLELGLLECGVLMQALGRHLVVEPVHACLHEAAAVLSLAGSEVQKQRWLPSIASGEHRLALAHSESGHESPWQVPRLLATPTANGWRLSGQKRAIRAGPGAARWIVSATTVDGGVRFFLVDPRTHGLVLEDYDTTEGGRAADASFDSVEVSHEDLLGDASADAGSLLRTALSVSTLMRCWEASGVMQAAAEQSASYMQQRKQFGRPLSEFQVVQHRLAEMSVCSTEAQAACELATMRLARGGEAADAASMARIKTVAAAQFIAKEAVQLHGAMGVCEELPIAATFRQLLAFIHADGSAATLATWRGHELFSSRAYELSQTL